MKPARGILRTAARLGLIAGALALAVTGGVAYGTTVGFGQNQVGTRVRRRPPDLLRPDHQAARRPAASTPYGKFMGSTVSPDGRFLAATTTDRSVARCRSSTCRRYKLIWRGRHRLRRQPAAHRQHRRPGRPDVLARRQVPLACRNATGLTRFPVNADGTLGAPHHVTIPTVNGTQALTGRHGVLARRLHPVRRVNGQNTVVAIDPGHRRGQADLERRHRPARADVRRAASSTSATRAAAGPRAGETTHGLLRHRRCPPTRTCGTSTTGTRQRHRHRRPVGAGRLDHGRPAPDRDVRPRASACCSSPTRTATPSRSSTPRRTRSCRRSTTKPWPSSDVGYEPDRHRDDQRRPPAGHASAARTRSPSTSIRATRRSRSATSACSRPTTTRRTSRPSATRSSSPTRRGIDARGPNLTFNKGSGTTPGDRSRHARHDRLADPLHAARATSDIARPTPSTVFAQNGWGDAGTDVKQASGKQGRGRAGARRASATRRRSSTSSCSSRRTAPTTRSTATCPRATATRPWRSSAQKVTPNQHALARQFGLYDNTYDVGTNSAEGHNWLMQGDNPEYTESVRG